MDRREAVLKIAAIMGITLSAPLLTGLLSGCDSGQGGKNNAKGPLVITNQQQKTIAQIAEIIIPATTTPGAIEAKVPEFIYLMLADCYSTEQQKAFFNGIDQFNQTAANKYGRPFPDCSSKEQVALVIAEENRTLTRLKNNAGQAETALLPFFKILKELTLVGYFTSEIGATQALHYVAVPGQFHGCVPLQPNQKAWAIS